MVFDPWADTGEVEMETSAKVVDAVDNNSCDAVIFTVGHHEFRSLTTQDVLAMYKNPQKGVLGDLKSLFPKSELESNGLEVFRF